MSDRLRKEGNKFYLKGIDDGLSPLLANDRLNQALKYYYQAKSSARTPDELSSTLKNIGKTNYRIAGVKSKELKARQIVKMSTKQVQKLEDEIKFYSKESLGSLFSALKLGSCKPEAWQARMFSDIALIFTDLIGYTDCFSNFDRRLAALFVLANNMVLEELRSILYLQIATFLHTNSVEALEQHDFRSTLRLVHEMNYPLEEAEKATTSEDTLADIRVLKSDAVYQLASAESMQACTIAIEQLKGLPKEVKLSSDMDMVLDTLDMFKDAALKAREISLGQEAMACYYQGHIFETFLKMKHKAKTFYMRVMHLTEAAKPKVFTSDQWYKDCVASLKVMQDEAREQDGEAQEEIKKRLRKEMEKELNDIEAAKTTGGPTELLRHIYSKHPPKNKPFKLADLKELDGWDDKSKSEKKKILLKAMADYHPDKNPKDKHGEKWHFLAQEITKSITSFHEIIKGLDE